MKFFYKAFLYIGLRKHDFRGNLLIRFTYNQRLFGAGIRMMWLRDFVIITDNVQETNTIYHNIHTGSQQAVPIDAGEEIQERRAIS